MPCQQKWQPNTPAHNGDKRPPLSVWQLELKRRCDILHGNLSRSLKSICSEWLMAGFHPAGPHIVLFWEENCHGEKSDGDVLFAAAVCCPPDNLWVIQYSGGRLNLAVLNLSVKLPSEWQTSLGSCCAARPCSDSVCNPAGKKMRRIAGMLLCNL